MGVKDLVRSFLPARALDPLRRARRRVRRERLARLPPLAERDFAAILAGALGLAEGDTVYVHSATDQLSLDFPFYRILGLLREAVGPRGNLLFPSYPNRHVSSYEYLLQGHVFDVRRTPSYAGLLTELARRQRDAVRSLHPTKSVCAIGPDARELTEGHHLSPYPYDRTSPYRKLVERGAKIVGLGVWTQYLTLVHAAEDALGDGRPVEVYHPRLFAARCVDYEGRERVVPTYAHDMTKVRRHDVPAFVKKYLPRDECEDLTVGGMRFFRADAAPAFERVLGLMRRGLTPYT